MTAHFQEDKCGYADMGGAYVGYQQTKIMQVLKELQLETYSKVSDLDSIMRLKVRPFLHSFICGCGS